MPYYFLPAAHPFCTFPTLVTLPPLRKKRIYLQDYCQINEDTACSISGIGCYKRIAWPNARMGWLAGLLLN